MKDRLDKLMVERKLAPSREKAQALIMAGHVRVDHSPASKAGSRISVDAEIEVAGKEHPYVSRGGVKMEGALRDFALNPAGLRALDIGASTGGFTHCLLMHGAERVFAVDVGYGQLAWELRNDPRVTVLERTNIRKLASDALGMAVDLVVVDVSFISLETVLCDAVRFIAPGGQVLGLLKPQFEAGRQKVGRGGRVKDPAVHREVLEQVAHAGRGLGLTMLNTAPSALPGKKSGNQEFFVLWQLDGQT